MDDKRRSIEKIIGERQELRLGVELAEESVQFVIVTLAGQWYGFWGNAVASIAKVQTVTPIPGTPDFMLGVMYYQGRVESVMDIKRLLGLPDTAITSKSRVVMATAGEVQSGILVDSVEDVVELPTRKIHGPLHTMEGANKEYVAGGVELQGRHVVLLDLARIFGRVLEQEDG